ncbi:MAG: CBS domain-containing protein [Paracoccus sp. (in: a-proteobacteria)]|jgi:CBS domain-containing protein
MLVNQILSMKPSGDIITVAPSVTVADAIRLLSEKRIGAVVVSEDGKTPLGILSERDVVRELGKRGVDVLTLTVSDLMTKKLITCTTGEDALAILERMTAGRFRHLPVVGDSGEMVGLISIGDAVFARLKELNAEKEALTGMIMGN